MFTAVAQVLYFAYFTQSSRWPCMAFNGKNYTQYMEQPKVVPAAIRVTWYEKWELITVPLEIDATLGL